MVHVRHQVEFLLVVGGLHAEVRVLSKLFEGFWWLPAILHVLCHHTSIFLLAKSFMLDVIVEAGTVGLLLQVGLYLVSISFDLVIAHFR